MSNKGLIVVLACWVAASANARLVKWFQAGNKALTEQRHDDAANHFRAAIADSPESAEPYYNLGNALYRGGAFEEAIAAYEASVALSKSDAVRGRGLYNMGNCVTRLGEAAREADPHAAAAYCRQAAWLYRAALAQDPHFENAAYNLEVTLRTAAGIEEQIRDQEEQEQQQNELFAYIREKLAELIERQTALLQTGETGQAQAQLRKETLELAAAMEASKLHEDIPLPDGTAAPGPLKETWVHTVNAADAMALPDQPTALAELIAALGSAPEDPNQSDQESGEESEDYEDYDMEYEESDMDAEMYEEADPFGDFSEYEEIRGVPPPNQTEMDILAEEVRNQERRKQKKAGEYKQVEKDW